MFITREKALNHAGGPVLVRSRVPDFLYMLVDDATFPTVSGLDSNSTTTEKSSYFSKRRFAWNDITKERLKIHLKRQNLKLEATSFVSAYENEATAMKFPPFSSTSSIKKGTQKVMKLIIDTKGLVPAWATTTAATHIPIWIEQGALPKVPRGVLYMTTEGFDSFEASAWICLDEVRAMFDLNENGGEKGEWLACGYIPRERVCGQVVLHDVRTREKRFPNEREEEVSKTKKKKKDRKETHQEEMLRCLHPPLIPVRTSSLRSSSSHDKSKRKDTHASKSTLHQSRDSGSERTVKLAQSLLKKALILSAEEVEKERKLQKDKDRQIRTELKISERRPDRGTAVHNMPAEATNADLDANERAEEPSSLGNETVENTLPRDKEPGSVASQDLERSPIPSRHLRHDILQEPHPDIESVIEDLAHTSITTTTPPLQHTSRKDHQKHVVFALSDESSSGRESHYYPRQDSPLDLEPTDHHLAHPRLPRDPSPPPPRPLTPSTNTPASSISPLTLAWFDRIERNLDRGIALKVRIAEVMARQEEKQEWESGNNESDCSVHVRDSRVDLWRRGDY
ncbi:Nn.00g031000.m01.CDS01 [Neocucurbitaria sp. VM-36]